MMYILYEVIGDGETTLFYFHKTNQYDLKKNMQLLKSRSDIIFISLLDDIVLENLNLGQLCYFRIINVYNKYDIDNSLRPIIINCIHKELLDG